jgi:transcriptional regulator with XRE-family HTH domain
MDQINQTIGNNLKKWRHEKGYTLDQVAAITGVSKSMIGQIERGDSTPTVTTLWKISNGLKISFSSLMDQEHDETYVITKESLIPLDEKDHAFKVLTYIPFNGNRKFETFMIECAPHAVHQSDAHIEAVEEFVIVLEGELSILECNHVNVLKKGDMIRFKADERHEYRNEGDSIMKALVHIVYT